MSSSDKFPFYWIHKSYWPSQLYTQSFLSCASTRTYLATEIKHSHGLLRHLNRIEPSWMLLVTPLIFLLYDQSDTHTGLKFYYISYRIYHFILVNSEVFHNISCKKSHNGTKSPTMQCATFYRCERCSFSTPQTSSQTFFRPQHPFNSGALRHFS